jgi:hypothetical protein
MKAHRLAAFFCLAVWCAAGSARAADRSVLVPIAAFTDTSVP